MGLASSTPEQTKAFSFPVGVTSPLWLAFAGAAGVGVAYWWMTRWTRERIAGAAPVLDAPAETRRVVVVPVTEASSAEASPAEAPAPVEAERVVVWSPTAEPKDEPATPTPEAQAIAEAAAPAEPERVVVWSPKAEPKVEPSAAAAKAEPTAEAAKPAKPEKAAVDKALKVEAKVEPTVKAEKLVEPTPAAPAKAREVEPAVEPEKPAATQKAIAPELDETKPEAKKPAARRTTRSTPKPS